MYSRIVTPPAVEPVSLTEAKLHLRLAVYDEDADLYDAEDSNISALITSAREMVEAHTRRVLITQTWDVAFDSFPEGQVFEFPFAPLQSVTTVTYINCSGESATFTDFTVDLFRNGIRLKSGFSWPSILAGTQVVVRFVAGYGASGAAVPASIRRSILLIIGHHHANREAVIVDTRAVADVLPLGVDSLLSPYRWYEF